MVYNQFPLYDFEILALSITRTEEPIDDALFKIHLSLHLGDGQLGKATSPFRT